MPTWRICCWLGRSRAERKRRCVWPSAPQARDHYAGSDGKHPARRLSAAIAGLVVAIAAARLLLALAFPGSHFLPISTTPSLMVLAFAFGFALITGIIFGAAPAWFATRTDPAEALRGSGRSTSDHSSFARKALLVVQATLSVVLVAGATMLARSLNKLEHQDFGYQVQGRVEVVAATIPRPLTRAEN